MRAKKKAAAAKKTTAAAKVGRAKKPQPAKQTKLKQLSAMLRRPEGATIAQIGKALDWQPHSVRGAISGSLKKKQGLDIVATKEGEGDRIYRIAD